MDRAYGARVVQVEPKFAEDAPLGYPTDGSSTGGQLATVPKAPWYNAVTEEIRNAIVGGGVKPDKNTLDQLNQSIEARLTKLEAKINTVLKGVTDRVDKFETFPPGFIIYAGCFINSPIGYFVMEERSADPVSRVCFGPLARRGEQATVRPLLTCRTY